MADNQLSGTPTDRVVFTKKSADRIARTVRLVEGMEPDASPLVFKKPIGESSSAARAAFRVCEFTGAWPVDTAKVLTFKYVTATPNTVTAMNLFANLTAAAGSIKRPCAIAREGTAWFLIAARC
jgi:hypothetical protein